VQCMPRHAAHHALHCSSATDWLQARWCKLGCALLPWEWAAYFSTLSEAGYVVALIHEEIAKKTASR
jgi:hypothetical protein